MSVEDLSKLGLTDLTEAQRKNLLKFIKKREQEAKEAVNHDQLVIKYGAAASRKPELFDPETTIIADYIDQFETYVALYGLQGSTAIRTFMTRK